MANSQLTKQYNSKKLCKFSNEGTCLYDNHHRAYRHICSYCDRLERVFHHPEVKCNMKNKPKDRQTIKSLHELRSLGQGPIRTVTECNGRESSVLGVGVGGAWTIALSKPNICYNTAIMYDNNVITCSIQQTDVKLTHDINLSWVNSCTYTKSLSQLEFLLTRYLPLSGKISLKGGLSFQRIFFSRSQLVSHLSFLF